MLIIIKKLFLGTILVTFLLGHYDLGLAQILQSEREFELANKLYEEQLYILAAEQFKDFAYNYPSNENADDALFLSGEAHFLSGNYSEAFKTFKDLEINYPRSRHLLQGRFRMAECQEMQENFENAAELFRRIPYFHPEDEKAALALLNAGISYHKAGKNDAALSTFSEVSASYPSSPYSLDATLEKINLFFQKGDYQEAMNQMDRLLQAYRADVRDPRFYFVRGKIARKLGQFQESKKTFQQLVQEFPSSPQAQEAYFELGELFQNYGDTQNALSYFNQYLATTPSPERKSLTHLRIGTVLLTRKELAAALENFQKAQAVEQLNLKMESHYKSGQVLLMLKRFDLADRNFMKAISLSDASNNEKIKNSKYCKLSYFGVVEASTQLKQFRKVIDLVKQFKEKYPDSPEKSLMDFLKAEIVEKQMRDNSRALRLYSSFIEEYPKNSRVDDAQLALGRCYEKLNEFRLALNVYQDYLEKYPAGGKVEWAQVRMSLIKESINIEPENNSIMFSNLLENFPNAENWNFELAKLNFELKQFTSAIEKFKSILNTSGNGVDANDVNYYLGFSYFKQAQKYKLLNMVESSFDYLDSARVTLKKVSNNLSDPTKSAKILYTIAMIELDTAAEFSERKNKLLNLYEELQNNPSSIFMDNILIQLGDCHWAAAKDNSVNIKSALNYYSLLLDKYPGSEFFQKAQFRKAAAIGMLKPDSTALMNLSDFIATFPNAAYTAEALLLRTKLEKRFANYESAKKSLRIIISKFFYSPLSTEARRQLAEILTLQNDLEGALDLYNDLERRTLFQQEKNNDNRFAFRKGELYERLDQPSEAIKYYLLYLQKNPDGAYRYEAALSVANLSQKQNNFALAKRYHTILLAGQAPVSYKYQANIALADILFEQKLFEEARTHYSNAVQLSENLFEEKYPVSQAIRCRYKRRQFAEGDVEAKVFEKKFNDIDEIKGQFLLDKANAYLAIKDFESAEKIFKKLKSRYKNTNFGAEGEFGLGAVYLITNHTEDALKILTNIPSKYPGSEITPRTYYNLGDFYYKNQQIENAIHAFKKVLEHPRSEEYHSNALLYLINCYRDIGNWDQGIVLTREFLNVYPNSKETFRRKIDLAQFLMNLKEYNRAIENFRNLLAISGKDSEAEIQFYIGQCFKEMGNFERATSEYLKVKYLTKPTKLPWHVTALFEAGRCLLRLKETEQAKKIFQQIVREEGSQSNFGKFAKKQLEAIDKEPHFISGAN